MFGFQNETKFLQYRNKSKTQLSVPKLEAECAEGQQSGVDSIRVGGQTGKVTETRCPQTRSWLPD